MRRMEDDKAVRLVIRVQAIVRAQNARRAYKRRGRSGACLCCISLELRLVAPDGPVSVRLGLAFFLCCAPLVLCSFWSGMYRSLCVSTWLLECDRTCPAWCLSTSFHSLLAFLTPRLRSRLLCAVLEVPLLNEHHLQ